MMALDPYNNLDEYPLENIDVFIDKCLEKYVTEINITGSNTDPLLYKHTRELTSYLRERMPNVQLGIRTNGALMYKKYFSAFTCYDKASISITTLDEALYKKTMGKGKPPDLAMLVSMYGAEKLKINVVLCPETRHDFMINTISKLKKLGIRKVNLREPYGQPHVGNPLVGILDPISEVYGMPEYSFKGMMVTYWDVHYVEVESVNLYANGIVSETYPITKGHDPVAGRVLDQNNFSHSGRQYQQWL